MKPKRLAADTAYGMGKLLAWLLDKDITPHIPVWERYERTTGIRFHHAGINGEALAFDQARVHAGPHYRLEHMAQDAAIAEAAMTIDRERRMIGNRIIEIEPAERPISEVQLRFLAQPALEADAVAVTHDQHPDHELRVDRRTPDVAIEACKLLTQVSQRPF